ncbi:MAG: RNA 2',3'-cyclic phosphodiesterase [Spirochaetota bacterium]|nr:RNA 2',3'-cyclic phosphodiesterase [Spirochaetota bacterium]
MRLFIAIHLNKPILKKIEELILPLANQYKDLKWVSFENMHITIKFLGETNDTNLDSIIKSLQEINLQSFNLTIQNLGAFPNINFPKVLWIGLKGDINSIKSLVKKVETHMKVLNFLEERREWSPHITIARVRTKIPKDLINFISLHKDVHFGEISISSFSLMESNLTSKGPIYKEIKRFTLS